MPLPAASDCAWPVDAGCFEDPWDELDDDVKARSIALASSTLRRLTGYRVGGCPLTVRPCLRTCANGWPSLSFYGAQGRFGASYLSLGWDSFWISGCGHGGDCSCAAPACTVMLPLPATSVTEVKVDGVVMDPTHYHLDPINGSLRNLDDPCAWPTCQDLTLPDTEPGTFAVKYLNSYPVDAQGAYAAGVLAMEFAKACTGGKCRLPTGLQSVVRQGVSYTVTPGAFPDGLTGIREVDTYLGLWNPGGLRQAPKVWSPDIAAPHVAR